MGPGLILLLVGGAATVAIAKKNQIIADMKKAIVAEAKKQKVNPAVALLFADLETNFQNVVGDTKWPDRKTEDGRTNWERWVRDEPKLAGNPYRDQKDAWISYGPYQLLSPFIVPKVDAAAHPTVLSDLAVNIEQGIKKIKYLNKAYKGDVIKMRLAYVCGTATGCSQSTADNRISQLKKKASKYGITV